MAAARNLEGGASDVLDVTGLPPFYVTLRWPILVGFVLLCLFVTIPNVLLWLTLIRLQNERDKEHLFWLLCQPGYTNEQRSQALSELLWLGNKEWRSARLERLDLTGAQLAGANLQQAHMEGCKLAGADLTDTRLRQTQLDQADLSNADLTGADLFEADLLKANLQGAILVGANLRGADIGQAIAVDAKFVSADLTAAGLGLAVLTGADLRFAKLVEADLSLADLSSTNLMGTNFSDADLNQADLSNSNWWRAIGLSVELTEKLQELFPPRDDATEALTRDFQKWLAEQKSAQE